MEKVDYSHGFTAIDVETTLNGNEELGLAHPMHPDNHVVLLGVKDVVTHIIRYTPEEDFDVVGDSPEEAFKKLILKTLVDDKATLCGHNLSFDLMYLYKIHPEIKEHLQKYRIWDTQLAEYILSGQKTKFSSLDDLAIKYGLPVKDDKIKAYFEKGLGADKIPITELHPYLVNDVDVTKKIAIQQLKLAIKSNQLDLIHSQMEALHATTEMMFNGLKINKETLDSYTVEVVNEYVDCKLALEEMCQGHIEDINSPKQWSQFFFGGNKKIKVKEAVGLYKNGKIKQKLVEKIITIDPYIAYTPDPDKVSQKTGQISVDDTVLSDMLLHTTRPEAKELINKLLKYRELSKQLSTYVQGLSKHVTNNFIHGKLNHTSTVTGRLSSTSPNLQNISNNPIKKIFSSRFKDGLIVEVDFNQLEVVALAHVTGDEQLISDIDGGKDIHSELYRGMFGRYPTKEERKPFKSRTFQLIYGAGAKAISKQAGCSLEEAKKFVDVFYTRYPKVAKWHEGFSKYLESISLHEKNEDGSLQKFKTATYQTETGRKFVFSEYYSDKEWSSRMYNFSPTEMKNYPIQGLATGDIVPMMLGVIFRRLKGREDVKMVNTVHDSLMFDVKLDTVGEFIVEIIEILRDTDKYFLKTFGRPLALKLNAGASCGQDWFNMKEITI